MRQAEEFETTRDENTDAGYTVESDNCDGDDHSRERERLPQSTLTGRIKVNKRGNDIITFTIPNGAMDLICIVNIPDEGVDRAPVYVKHKFVGNKRNRGS